MKTNKYIQFSVALIVFLMFFNGNIRGSKTYTLITDIASLSTNDYIVLLDVDDVSDLASANGVTGWDSSKDATVGASGWKEYKVTKSLTTFTLYDADAEAYIATPTGNHFKYDATAGDCSVDEDGWLICNSRYLAINGSNYRFYETSQSYAAFYIWKVGDADPHTVNFSATGGTPGSSSLTEASGGAGVTLPNVIPTSAVTAAGWGFYGWATATVGAETTTAPTIVGKSGDTYYPAADITLYAVYAKGTYTKVTSMSSITSGDKCIIIGHDNNNTAVYAMTSVSYTYNSTVERLKGKLIDTSPATTYSAAVIHANWRCEITYASTNQYYIQNLSTSKYVDTQCGTSSLCTTTKYGSDHYTITYANGSDGYCSILNNESGYGGRYLVVFVGGDFGKNGSAWEKMMIYKETTAPKYVSAPCTNIVTLSEGSKTNVSSIAFSESGVQTCSSTAADRNFTVTVTTNTGYEVTSSSNLTFSKSSGTATASYVSGPTGSGPYTFTYRFAQDDSGAGTFSATATAKTYTITLNDNGATTEGTDNVTATYNSATLSSAITNPKKTHYIFQGWYSGSGGTGNLVINKDGELQDNVAGYTGEGGVWTRDAATTLYAKWTEHSYTNYRTKCCDDPALTFGTIASPVTDYEIVREDLASASTAVEIDVDYESLNTSTSVTWYSTKRNARTFVTPLGAYTWTSPTSQPSEMQLDIANKKISAATTGVYVIKIKQEGATISATVYCDDEAEVTVTVKTVDKFVDAVNGNFSGEPQRLEDVGGGILLPTEATFSTNDACHLPTRRLLGWIKASDLETYRTAGNTGYIDSWKTGDASNKVIAPGTRVAATGVTWYAVWGEEVTP